MRLSAAVSPARPIKVPFDGGEVLGVEYRPASYTPAQLAKMSAQAKESKDPAAAVESMIGTMLDLLVSWDLTTDDDQPVPLTREALRDVPLNVHTEIMAAVGRDQQVGEAAGG